MIIAADTKLTAVIGNPIKHSLSPVLHNAIYAKEKVNAVMLAFENQSIERLVESIRSLPVHLAAVTIPHKQSIMPLLDKIDPVAEKIGAVNTVINEKGALVGYNTDVVGIEKVLKDMRLAGKNVLLIGAGGAARPVAYVLSQANANIFIFNRTRDKADLLAEDFGGLVIDNLTESSFDVIINTTSVGMHPHDGISPIPSTVIRRGAIVFDCVYAPLETRLLKDAKKQGAKTISGLSMFIAQGLEQEKLWLKKTIRDRNYSQLIKSALIKRKN